MLDVNYIRDNFDLAVAGLEKRNMKIAASLLEEVIALDDKRKASQAGLDEVLAQSNKLSKEIGALFQSGKKEEAEVIRQKTADLKEESKQLQDEQNSILELLEDKLIQIPNIPHFSVPKGKTPEENEVVRTW